MHGLRGLWNGGLLLDERHSSPHTLSARGFLLILCSSRLARLLWSSVSSYVPCNAASRMGQGCGVSIRLEYEACQALIDWKLKP